MSLFERPNGTQYHDRTISVKTFDYDEEAFVVEGCLTDERIQPSHMVTGEPRPAGILHRVIIHLLVGKATLKILDLRISMPTVPREECRQAGEHLEVIKGASISRGFTAKVKALAGHGKGCQHLAELLTVMGSAAYQGKTSYCMQSSNWFTAAKARIMTDTCFTWRADGPLMKAFTSGSRHSDKKGTGSDRGEKG